MQASREQQRAANELMMDIRASSTRFAASNAAAIAGNEEVEAQRTRQRAQQVQSLNKREHTVQEQSSSSRNAQRAPEGVRVKAAGQALASGKAKSEGKAARTSTTAKSKPAQPSRTPPPRSGCLKFHPPESSDDEWVEWSEWRSRAKEPESEDEKWGDWEPPVEQVPHHAEEAEGDPPPSNELAPAKSSKADGQNRGPPQRG